MTTLTALQSEMEKLQAKIAAMQEQENKPETWRDQARPEVRAIAEKYGSTQLQKMVNEHMPYNVIYQYNPKFLPTLNTPDSKHYAFCLRVRETMAGDGVPETLAIARLAYAYYLLTTGKTGNSKKQQKAEPAKVAEPAPTLAELQATRETLAKMGMDTTAIDAKIASLQAVDEETETETAVNPIVALATLRAERDAIAATAKTGNPAVDRFLAHRFGGDYWQRVANGQQDPSAHFVALAGRWANGEATDDEAIYEIKPAKTETEPTTTTTTTKTEPAVQGGKEAKYQAFLADLPGFIAYGKKHGKAGEWINDTRYTGDRSVAINPKTGKVNENWLAGKIGSDVHKAHVAKHGPIVIK